MKTLRSWCTPMLALWVVLLLSDTGGQLFLKMGGDHLAGLPFGLEWIATAAASHWIWTALACYCLSFLTWMLILRRTQLSLAFPLTALVYISVIFFSVFALGEAIEFWRYFGVAVIIAGVVVIGREEA